MAQGVVWLVGVRLISMVAVDHRYWSEFDGELLAAGQPGAASGLFARATSGNRRLCHGNHPSVRDKRLKLSFIRIAAKRAYRRCASSRGLGIPWDV
jgi:hypothetical protein